MCAPDILYQHTTRKKYEKHIGIRALISGNIYMAKRQSDCTYIHAHCHYNVRI